MRERNIMSLRHLNLYMNVGGLQGRMMWTRPVQGRDDTYEVSLEFEHPQGAGYQTWFVDKSGRIISCSMYLSPETEAIRLAEDIHNAGMSINRFLELTSGRDDKVPNMRHDEEEGEEKDALLLSGV